MLNKLVQAFDEIMQDFIFKFSPPKDTLLEDEIDIWANEHPELTRQEIKEVLDLFSETSEFLPPTIN